MVSQKLYRNTLKTKVWVYLSLRGKRLKGSFRCERNARAARGGREGNACQETVPTVFLVFNINQANVKILIGQSSKRVNHSLHTLIRLAEINITRAAE